MAAQETLLQILQSEPGKSRVSIAMVHCSFAGETRLRLRQESYSDDVGWFTQSHVDLSPDQIGQLKMVLGPLATTCQPNPRTVGRATSSLPSPPKPAAILRFPREMAG